MMSMRKKRKGNQTSKSTIKKYGLSPGETMSGISIKENEPSLVEVLIGRSQPEIMTESSGRQKLNVGSSIVDYLKSTGKDSSYSARKAMAKEMGIEGYSGSARQNIAMLKSMKSSGPSTMPTSPSRPRTAPESRLVDDYYIEGGDDVASQDQDLIEQNRDYIGVSDINDGKWRKYKNFVRRLRDESPEESASYPNYAEYQALLEQM